MKQILVHTFIILITFSTLTGCTTPQPAPVEPVVVEQTTDAQNERIPLGDEVNPPFGCVELRNRTGDPDAC